MSVIFTKELPQSSDQDDASSLCMEKFANPPRTLYDEIGQQEQDFYISPKSAQENSEIDWQSLVYRLQVENTSLVNSLHETNNDLMQSRREKEELENFIQRQTKTTDNIVFRLKETVTNLIENQKEERLKYDKLLLAAKQQHQYNNHNNNNHQVLDLIFQKKYIMMENEALKESQQEINDYYGIQPLISNRSTLFKWRSCVYALIALQRFQKSITK